MLIGHMRVSNMDGAQALDPKRDALLATGVDPAQPCEDQASGKRDGRPGLEACLKSLCPGDTLVACKLDRLGRDLHHLVNLAHELTGQAWGCGSSSARGRLSTPPLRTAGLFAAFAALAEFERELVAERTRTGLASARARSRCAVRPYKTTPAKLRLAQAAMGQRETRVSELRAELGITRQTLYRHMDPQGRIRPDGGKLLRRRHTERQQGLPAGSGDVEAGERHA